MIRTLNRANLDKAIDGLSSFSVALCLALINAHLKDITGEAKIFFKDLQDHRNNLHDLRSKACKEGIANQDMILPIEDLLEDLLVCGDRFIPFRMIRMADFVINTILKNTDKISMVVYHEMVGFLRQ